MNNSKMIISIQITINLMNNPVMVILVFIMMNNYPMDHQLTKLKFKQEQTTVYIIRILKNSPLNVQEGQKNQQKLKESLNV
jgi:hypothetical protein